MSHFSAEQWFELARGVAPAEQKIQMESHLEEGCEPCRKLFRMWTEALDISRRESRYRPPAGVIRSAKATFVPEASWKWFPEIAETAKLIFDSLTEPIPSTIRGSTTAARHFVQEAGPFLIDLRVEFEPVRNFVRVIGQVLNSVEPTEYVEDLQIYLLKGEELAGQTAGDKSGEFILEFEDVENRSLFADIGGKRVIEITLPPFFETAGR
jgi:hypothetical protein